MEQDVDTGYRTVCSACLSSDRDLYDLSNLPQVYQIFRLLMYDFSGDRFGDSISEIDQLVCWECLALMKRFHKFKWQVHSAQEHLRVLAISRTQESMDHTYMSQSLSCLEMETKVEYDKIYFDFSAAPEDQGYIINTQPQNVKSEHYEVAQVVSDNNILDIDDHILEVPEIVLENPVTGVMSHIVVGTDALVSSEPISHTVPGSMPHLTVGPLTSSKIETVIMCQNTKVKEEKPTAKLGYITEYMSEADMLACREEAKQKVQYASSVYKCELCIIGFYTQQQVEDHFVSAHRAKPGQVPCKVCYIYIEESKLPTHTDSHYLRYNCKLCAHSEMSNKLIRQHVSAHMSKQTNNASIKIGDVRTNKGRKKKEKEKEGNASPPKPGDLRKLLSKTSIEVYQCLECDMFFKNSRARKNHVARFHREGLQCDHCKKRFVNRTTLATHLKLHEGPLPRAECTICHKMVRVIQLKYHIQRHQNKSRYECEECNKTFSHLATYQAHLKYSRAHASDQVFKFPCPMCNKGYPTKEAMQDHFNYQHLGKTVHKCPLCEKPIASRANVEKHMMRVHGQKKEKPRNHVCQECGKGFTDKKALTQHEVIHSGERPLSCDICQQTFKQKASLYTHRKRVHKVFPAKRLVEYMDDNMHCKQPLDVFLGTTVPATNLQIRTYQADHADYHFVHCSDQETDPSPRAKENKTQDFQQNTLPNLDLRDDDALTFNDIYSSDDNMLKKEKATKKVKKKKKDKKVIKKDRRCKPANEVLNNDIFNIKDLTQEEQMYEVNKRQFSTNYKNSGFKCNECYKGFLDKDAFKGHMIRHTDQCGIYSCTICKIRFKKLQALRNHRTSHMQKFSCKRCNYVTFRRHAAKLHEEYHNGTKYVCPHCMENFDKLSTYMSHIRIKHPSDIVCQLCGYSFVSDKGLGLHKKLKHRFNEHQVPTDGPWCTKCNVQFINKEALDRHVQLSPNHSDEIKSRKLHAPRSYRDPGSSNIHNDTKRTKKRNISKPKGPIACEQCEMQLPDPLSYYRHFRRVHPDKNRTNYPSMKSKSMCEVCGKMFQSLALLQDHSWTHTDSKQFKCSACDKQFVRKYRLIAHQRVHGGTRGTHTCSVCSKSFTTASNMQRHMVSHTGLKPFKCEVCGKCFKHASEKRVHVTYVHLKKPWPKRARAKRKEDRQNETQTTPMLSDIQPEHMDIRIENKPMYYNMKM